MNLDQAEAYFLNEINNLRQIADFKNPWIFLCASAYIEYLSKLAAGRNSGGAGFKEFVREFMPVAYRDFVYKSGKDDLPEQLYHVLRCGIVHSFSLIPDQTAIGFGGRPRSVILAHEGDHLGSVNAPPIDDACSLNAYNFVDDLEYATRKLLDAARTDPGRATKVTDWLAKHPPIMAIPSQDGL